jgi:hypothetical protein
MTQAVMLLRLLDRLRDLGVGARIERLAVRLLLDHWADPALARHDLVFWLGYPRYQHPPPRAGERGVDLYSREMRHERTIALRDLV